MPRRQLPATREPFELWEKLNTNSRVPQTEAEHQQGCQVGWGLALPSLRCAHRKRSGLIAS